MTHLEQRIKEKGWELLHKKIIDGAHAGRIFRIDVLDEENKRGTYIYKEFAAERNNEVGIYGALSNHITPFSKLIEVWDSSPQAILMCDLGSSLKITFDQLSIKDKRSLIVEILQRLSDLHTTNLNLPDSELITHRITSEWRNWCIEETEKLCAHHKWAEPEWVQTLEDTYKQLDLYNFEVRSPLVLTHGDPHLENIFRSKDQIWLIDWEWAAYGSPLRDITILLQDIYNPDLIQFVFESYRDILEAKKYFIEKEDYKKDFEFLYVDHTTMMLAWEIEKYFQGYTSEDEIKKITEFKIGEIRRIMMK
ncbi:phosphotransferase family protein [Halobacillus ihumii]|uniref:phosphotransferase family protein n=1 Tax=Halobacillus ihumii TaxID=2686092 RepID=UPI0013D54533|nr:phosphotransferase [Halobacillus ihumii]